MNKEDREKGRRAFCKVCFSLNSMTLFQVSQQTPKNEKEDKVIKIYRKVETFYIYLYLLSCEAKRQKRGRKGERERGEKLLQTVVCTGNL